MMTCICLSGKKTNLSTLVSYLWYDASLRGRKVTAQLIHRVGNQSKYLSLFDWCFICSIYQTFSGVLSIVTFLTNVISNSHLNSISHSLYLFLSLSPSPSPAYSPLLFCLSQFHIKRKGVEPPASLNKLIYQYQSLPHLMVSIQYMYTVAYFFLTVIDKENKSCNTEDRKGG